MSPSILHIGETNCVLQLLDGIVILCAFILNPLARRRRKRLAAAESAASTEAAEAPVDATGDLASDKPPEVSAAHPGSSDALHDKEKTAEVRCGEV